MGKSILVFVSHASEDKDNYIIPIIEDLESCFINIWLDKKRILPGESLRHSIIKEGLDKADVVLIFFTLNSLKSAWVDREVKHVLREESKRGNNFDLNKIISIYDSKETYQYILDRYPELTDYLLHLMPFDYDKTDLGKLISAIWLKHFNIQGGDTEIQRQLLSKDKEIFQKDKEINDLKSELIHLKENNADARELLEFSKILGSNRIQDFIAAHSSLLSKSFHDKEKIPQFDMALAFGLVEYGGGNTGKITQKGVSFFKWLILNDKLID